MSTRQHQAEFDSYGSTYETDLGRGLSLTGEDRAYFAQARADLLASRLRVLGVRIASLLDFGCGDGASTGLLATTLGASRAVGIDVSSALLDVAHRDHERPGVAFMHRDAFTPDASFDLAFVNGVFHHIPVAERASAVADIAGALKPGGLVALWENNPWNPGTRIIMRRVPFDRNAILVSAPGARRLLADGGFDVLRTDFAFIFPRMLAWFRRIEPVLSRLPFGGQYQVLARKR